MKKIIVLFSCCIIFLTSFAFATTITMSFSGSWDTVTGSLAQSWFGTVDDNQFTGYITYSTSAIDNTDWEYYGDYDGADFYLHTIGNNGIWIARNSDSTVRIVRENPDPDTEPGTNSFAINGTTFYQNLEMPDALESELFTSHVVLDFVSTLDNDSLPDFGLTEFSAVTSVDSYFTKKVLDFSFGSGGQAHGSIDSIMVEVRADPVPEPATLMLFCLGLAGLGLVSRKK